MPAIFELRGPTTDRSASPLGPPSPGIPAGPTGPSESAPTSAATAIKPVALVYRGPATCDVDPVPNEPIVTLPGLAFA